MNRGLAALVIAIVGAVMSLCWAVQLGDSPEPKGLLGCPRSAVYVPGEAPAGCRG